MVRIVQQVHLGAEFLSQPFEQVRHVIEVVLRGPCVFLRRILFCRLVTHLTAAGEEAQVDYGTGPMVRDPQSGKYRRTRLFVMTLGYSRKSVRLLVFRSSSRIWAELQI